MRRRDCGEAANTQNLRDRSLGAGGQGMYPGHAPVFLRQLTKPERVGAAVAAGGELWATTSTALGTSGIRCRKSRRWRNASPGTSTTKNTAAAARSQQSCSSSSLSRPVVRGARSKTPRFEACSRAATADRSHVPRERERRSRPLRSASPSWQSSPMIATGSWRCARWTCSRSSPTSTPTGSSRTSRSSSDRWRTAIDGRSDCKWCAPCQSCRGVRASASVS